VLTRNRHTEAIRSFLQARGVRSSCTASHRAAQL
jgi:hypothetical protein